MLCSNKNITRIYLKQANAELVVGIRRAGPTPPHHVSSIAKQKSKKSESAIILIRRWTDQKEIMGWKKSNLIAIGSKHNETTVFLYIALVDDSQILFRAGAAQHTGLLVLLPFYFTAEVQGNFEFAV